MNIFEIMAAISINTSAYKKGIEDAKKQAEEFKEKGSGAFGKFSDMAKGALKTTAITAKEATASVVGLTKSSLSAYGEYEQLAGGVQKLYGNMGMSLDEYAKSVGKSTDEVRDEWEALEKAQTIVLENAQEAFKNSGMSMNAYMDTATQFSASLVSSLNGDTVEAAKITDVAMRSISDNWNTFGSDLDSITNAYKGFSKQNYTMLDNLKLGYGGTKSEMERLLNDAGKLAIEQGKVSESAMRVTVDEEKVAKATEKLEAAQSRLADRQSAVSKAQITYDEAVRKNGENSVQAQKAAISLSEAQRKLEEASNAAAQASENLAKEQEGTAAVYDINNFSDIIKAIEIIQENQKIAKTTQREATTTLQGSINMTRAAWDNLVTGMAKKDADIDKLLSDVIDSALSVADNVEPMIDRIATSLESLIDTALPKILDKIPSMLERLLPKLISVILKLANKLVDAIPQVLPVVFQAIQMLIQSIGESLPEILSMLVTLIETNLPTLIDNLVELALQVIDMLTQPDVISGLINAALTLVLGLLDGILRAIPKIVEALPGIVKNIISGLLQSLPLIVEAGIKLFVALVQNKPAIIAGIVAAIPQIIGAIFESLASFGLDLGKIFYNAWEGIKAIFSPGKIGEWFGQVWAGIQNAFSQVGEWFSSIFSKAWEDIKNVFAPVGQTFQNIGDSILNGLKSAINGIIWGINQVIKVPFDGLNSALMGIKSVEIMGWKPFDWIGEIYVPQIPELARGGVLKRGQIALLEGQGDEAVIPLSQNTEWIDMVADRLNNQQEHQNPQYTFHISIANMRADSIEDIENLAEMLMNVMAEKTSRKGAAY